MTHRLRLSASATALGLALLAAPQAGAQGFNANPLVITPGITIVRTPGVDTIRVGTAQGIINWINTDLPAPVIDFLPAGNSANFVNEGVADFVVLNRIQMRDPATVARFAGTVTSRLTTGGAPSPGGTLWFYSPGGILVGNGAVFDVGSLLLTANQPVVFDTDGDGTPDSLFGPSGEIQLRSLRNDSRAAVVVEQNAQFIAPREGSYIAMVAPRIDMRGQVRVNGSAAYVAAEDLDITISAGLFDFSIIEGSFVDPTIAGDDETLRYAGATGGPSSSGAGDNHVTYLVAMPKNEAVTMLVTGSLGYDAASGAVVENGVIYLSAGGFSDQTTDIVRAPGQTISPASDPPGSIEISTVNVTSRLQAFATDSIFVRNGGSATSNYTEDAAFYAGNAITLLTESKGAHVFGGNALFAANNGVGGSFTFTGESDSTTDIAGDFLVDVGDNSEGGGAPALGGNLALGLNAADLLVAGDIVLDARGIGVFGSAVAEGRGGVITVDAEALSAISAANFTADATGIGAGTNGQAVDGFGGQVTITADNSTIDVAGLGRAVADGIGGNGGDVGAGNGFGGDVSLASLDGAAVTVGTALLLRAESRGGDGIGGTDGGDGDGSGATAKLTASGGSVSALQIAISTQAFGGDGDGGGTGGDAIGGTSTLATAPSTTNPGASDISADLVQLLADGFGGSALSPIQNGGDGGDGQGGTAVISLADGSAGAPVTPGPVSSLNASASGRGGAGDDSNTGGILGGGGGDGFGGAVDYNHSGGDAIFGVSALFADGLGGAGGNSSASAAGAGGNGAAGTVSLASSGGTLDADDISGFARGFGGTGGNGEVDSIAGGDGGTGTSGDVTATFGNAVGPVTVDQLTLNTFAVGGAGGGAVGSGARGDGGAGDGGDALLQATDGAAQLGFVVIDASAVGGDGDIAGDGVAGDANLVADNGAVTATDVVVAAHGLGGSGGASGGAGIGGRASIAVLDGGSIDATGPTRVSALAIGGDAAGVGGIGDGGNATILVDGGTFSSVLATDVLAFGLGGDGGGANATGLGGDATVAIFDASGSAAFGVLDVDASGIGGDTDGAAGGMGTGGNALVFAQLGTLTADSLRASGNGRGGSVAGAAGGDGTAGSAALTSGNATITIGATTVLAEGFGGDGGDGGDATGGDAVIGAGIGAMTLGATTISANATGGAAETGGTAGDATGVNAQLTARQGAGSFSSTSLAITAVARGHNAFAGETRVLAFGSTVDVGDLTMDSGAIADVGAATGDLALVEIDGARFTAASSLISGDALGAGATTAGNITLRTQDTSGGGALATRAEFGTTRLQARAPGGAGVITLENFVPDPAGAMRFTTLSVESRGAAGTPVFVVRADEGRIDIDDDATIALDGDASFAMDGAGTLTAEFFTLTTSGDVTIDHVNPVPANLATINARVLEIFADNILAGPPGGRASRLRGTDRLTLNAAGAIEADRLDSDLLIELDSGANMTIREAVSGGDIDGDAGGDLTIELADAAGAVTLTANNLIDADTLLAGTNIAATANNIVIAQATAGDSITLAATQRVAAADLRASSDIIATAGNDIAIDFINADGSVTLDAGDAIATTSLSAGANIDLAAGGAIDLPDATVGGNALVVAGGALTIGQIEAIGDASLSGATITADLARADGNLTLDSGGALIAQDLIAGGNLTAVAAGDADVGEAVAGGDVSITANAIDADAIDAGASIILASGTDLTLGDLLANGDIRLSAADAIDANLLDAGGDIALSAGGDINATDAQAGGNIDLLGLSVDAGALTAAGDIAASAIDGGLVIDSADAFGAINLRATRFVRVGNLVAEGEIAINASDLDPSAPLATVDMGAATTFERVTVTATGDITAGSLRASGVTLESGEDVRLAVGESDFSFRIDAGGSIEAGSIFAQGSDGNGFIMLLAGGDITAGELSTTQGLIVDAGGAVDIGHAESERFLVSITGGQSVEVDRIDTRQGGVSVVAEIGSARIGSIDARLDVGISAGGTIEVTDSVSTREGIELFAGNGISLNDVSAGTQIRAGTLATLSIDGRAAAPEIALASSDIELGADAFVTGDRLSLGTFDGVSTMFIGDFAESGGYRLDNAEANRLDAIAISIGTGLSVFVGDLDLAGSRAAGRGGFTSLSITSRETMQVVGEVNIGEATGATALSLTAGQSLRVLTPGGGIALTGAGGALAGTLVLTSGSVRVGSEAAFAAVDAAGDIAARDEALGRNPGPVNDAGWLQADRLVLAGANEIYIQNSGPDNSEHPDRRGFTANTLELVTTGAGPTAIVINGRISDGAGGFITGADVIPAAGISGQDGAAVQFDPGSTINSCLILGGNCLDLPPPPPPVPDFPGEPVDPGLVDRVEGDPPFPPMIDLVELTEGDEAPWIDDPVTGAGNEERYIDRHVCRDEAGEEEECERPREGAPTAQ